MATILMFFPEIVPARETRTEIGKSFLVFLSAAVGLFREWAQCCSVISTRLNAALSVVFGLFCSHVHGD